MFVVWLLNGGEPVDNARWRVDRWMAPLFKFRQKMENWRRGHKKQPQAMYSSPFASIMVGENKNYLKNISK